MEMQRLAAGRHWREIEVGGGRRGYLIHVPRNVPSNDWPVLLAFHGSGSNADSMLEFSGLAAKSEQAGFVAVFPNGSGRIERARSFNAGNCCGYALRQQIDDIAFVEALLDDLERLAPVDRRRIYATGMSNGALMCYLAASRLSRRIAAIAPVAGPMGTESCSPARAVPVCHFHGTDDEFAPYRGGKGRRSITGTDFYSVEHTIGCWVKANRCDPAPETEELPARVDDGTRIKRQTWRGPIAGGEVVLYTIVGGGHTWPGGSSKLRYLGVTTGNLSANDCMWDFFQRHRLESQ